MDFLRSRLVFVGALLAVPFAQLSGCSVKERTFEPVAGEGGGGTSGAGGATAGRGGSKGGGTGGNGNSGDAGEMNGASAAGGDDSGGSSGRAGSSGRGGSAGRAGSDGSGGESGEPGSGGTGEGGAGTGNAGTGTSGSAGESGYGGAPPECVPGASTENDCDDGIDNDCDGVTDCLTLVAQFPDLNGAAAAEHVEYRFGPKASTATFECRRTPHATTGSGAWGSCGRTDGGSLVYPFPDRTSNDTDNDGLWTTEVRLSFPGGGKSNVLTRLVYVHSSLAAATRCPVQASDEAYFTTAAGYVEAGNAFVDSTIRAPFLSIDFDPPINGTYEVSSEDGTINLMSLRHRFSFSTDKRLMLMTRNYPSRLGSYGCNATRKRVHTQSGSWTTSGAMTYQTCTGIVFNKAGAGVCLSASGGAVVSVEHERLDYGIQIPDSVYSPLADNFAWRKLRAKQISGFSVAFSPKCDDEGCNDMNATALFLPDKGYFSYWRD